MSKPNPTRRAVLAGAAASVMAKPADARQAFAAMTPSGCDRVVIWKASRKMALYAGDDVLGIYRVGLGFEPEGHKTEEGDGKTPEGLYYISARNPQSAYHLSLKIDYPNQYDLAHAEAEGKNPGGDIYIHGGSGWFRASRRGDWTAGCVAVSNRQIEEIWQLVPIGTPVIIQP